jgi:hypothetical protein
MKIYYIIILGFILGSCFAPTDNQLLGQWKCYKEVLSSPSETRIDTLINRQIVEFKGDYTYEHRRWNMTGHGTWLLTKHNDHNDKILSMISNQGFSAEYLVDKLGEKELVLVSIDTISGEVFRIAFFYERLEAAQPTR